MNGTEAKILNLLTEQRVLYYRPIVRKQHTHRGYEEASRYSMKDLEGLWPDRADILVSRSHERQVLSDEH